MLSRMRFLELPELLLGCEGDIVGMIPEVWPLPLEEFRKDLSDMGLSENGGFLDTQNGYVWLF